MGERKRDRASERASARKKIYCRRMDDFHSNKYINTKAGYKRAGNERTIREKIKNEATATQHNTKKKRRNKINKKLQANQTYRARKREIAKWGPKCELLNAHIVLKNRREKKQRICNVLYRKAICIRTGTAYS